MFNPFNLFRPKKTFERVTREVVSGLKDNTVTLAGNTDQAECVTRTSATSPREKACPRHKFTS